jgi:hypothetical protein
VQLDFATPEFEASPMSPYATRIEVRLQRQHLPIFKLRQTCELLDIEPFIDLKLRKFEHAILTKIPDRDYPKVLAMLYLLERKPFQNARQELNRNRKFEREIGKYLGSISNIDLNSIWRHRVMRFLDKDESI